MINGKDLIECIIDHFGKVNAKQLQKIAYLTELEFMKKHGERLSNLEFVKLFYGPYSFSIKEIEEEDENIQVTTDSDYIILKNEKVPVYTYKQSQLRNKKDFDLDPSLKEELSDIFKKFKGKTGKELEEIADVTEPFLDVEEMNEKIDLDGYAEYYKALLSDKFWGNAIKTREDNEKKGIYGKTVIKDKSELKAIFS